ncbi:aspartate aminotransferase family protein [Microcella alkalica]|uniref:4-aminobutyrate aminotransferase-like enzyme n=1 Tax=Microcella alkalica TaxID=355930 RepID=A0A839EAU1_9MICO|nr:aspartate aminotransferase family protein [Microcella alkalica]MBA8847354.1 4-aminobutyrate aminotransferase-like enzyme [Microcella alkalica]
MTNSYSRSNGVQLAAQDAALLDRRERVLGAPYRLFYQRPVHFVRGEGVFLYDADGNDYLDAYNNVPVVGHSNPVVRARVSEQLGILNTHTRYLTDGVVSYAERLIDRFGGAVEQAVFVCSGSEAVDLALRMARHVTRRRGIIATSHAYHGTTDAAAAISPSLGPNNEVPADIALVAAPDLGASDPQTEEREFAARVDHAIADLRARGVEPAALIIDSIMSSDGLHGTVPVLGAAAQVIRRHGGLYIADEVQPGFGRTGDWWGFERHELAPDLVVIGKPMGNGVPIAAVLGRASVFDSFGGDVRYFNTFGGNPVSIAAADAVLDEIDDRGLRDNAATVGADLRAALSSLAAEDDGISSVRGAGLFLALELQDDGVPNASRATAVVNHMRDARVLISASGPAENVLKIRPPLVFGSEHLPRLADALRAALAASPGGDPVSGSPVTS